MIRIIFFVLCLVAAVPAAAQLTVSSPGNVLTVELTTTPDGRVQYSLSRMGKPIIDKSRLGFLFTDEPQLLHNLGIIDSDISDQDASWTTPWGEDRRIRDRHRRLVVNLREKAGLKRAVTMEFRLFDDGIGFRYRMPDRSDKPVTNIAEELTSFDIASDGKAWWAPAFENNRAEYLYEESAISAVGTGQTPLTMVLADGTHVSIHEAALVDYSGMNLARSTGTEFRAVLTPSTAGPRVSRVGAFDTPWRVVMVAPDAPALYAARNIILNLNEPNKLGDVSWVEPMKYLGIWWGMHLDTQSWNIGPKHGATTENAIKLIDFAAANGISGVLIEGWNYGWEGNWFANGWVFDFTKPYPDFDLPRVAAYAKSKGVHIIGHHETSANAAHYEDQMEAAFDYYESLGIDAVKTGYVSEAGQLQAYAPDGTVRFEWHEGQLLSRHHLKVVKEAAKRRIAINPHEPIKDTGLRRTYPNWMTREGQRGMEYNAWGEPKNPPSHDPNLLFTRLLAGPFDYTPGIVSLKGRNDSDILSTLARQLALYVVMYSPLQMAADLQENYEAEPIAFDFIKQVPVDWDSTRVLSGAIGDYAVVARKDRNSADWYVGGVTDEAAREIDVSFDFLPAGKRYRATIYRDGPTAEAGAKGKDMVVETRDVRRGDTARLRMAPGGGFAIRVAAR